MSHLPPHHRVTRTRVDDARRSRDSYRRGAFSMSAVATGDIIAGKYEVERVIGEGGMGFVVAARHRELGHRVAIKLLSAEALGNADAFARFEREGRASATLQSDHVAHVLD